jgi:hypothetical protein
MKISWWKYYAFSEISSKFPSVLRAIAGESSDVDFKSRPGHILGKTSLDPGVWVPVMTGGCLDGPASHSSGCLPDIMNWRGNLSIDNEMKFKQLQKNNENTTSHSNFLTLSSSQKIWKQKKRKYPQVEFSSRFQRVPITQNYFLTLG